MFGVALIYWKLIEKKPLSKMGLTKRFGNYFIGAAIGIVLLFVSVCAIIVTGNIEFHGLFKNADIFMIILLLGQCRQLKKNSKILHKNSKESLFKKQIDK